MNTIIKSFLNRTLNPFYLTESMSSSCRRNLAWPEGGDDKAEGWFNLSNKGRHMAPDLELTNNWHQIFTGINPLANWKLKLYFLADDLSISHPVSVPSYSMKNERTETRSSRSCDDYHSIINVVGGNTEIECSAQALSTKGV